MNIKYRTLITVCVVLLTLSGLLVYQGISQQTVALEESLQKEEKHIDTIVDSVAKYSLSPYLTRIQHIQEAHPQIVAAFAARDREGLQALAAHEYQVLQKENEYFHAFDFTLPDGTVFLRVQRPDMHGDNISQSREIIRHVDSTRETAAGFDVGKHGAIYWIAHPLYLHDQYLGIMEFGISAQQLTDAIRQRLGNEVTIAVRAKVWQKAVLIQNNIRRIGEYFLMTEGKYLYEKFPADINFDQSHLLVTFNEKTNLVHSRIALNDYRGDAIGKIIVLQDISEKLTAKRNFVVRSVLIAVVLVGTALLIISLTIHRLVGKLVLSAEENRLAKEELQHAHDALELRVAERTAELAAANTVLQQEITERSRAEERNHEQREFLQSIIESLTNPFYVIDVRTHKIVLANQAAYGLTKRPREGLTCHAMTHNRDTPCTGDEHVCALAEVKLTKRPVRVEHIHCDSKGDGLYFEVYAYPIFDRDGNVKQVIEYNVDISERKKNEEEKKKIWAQLLQSQKMEAVGMLASGVAHDFNNILTSIIGNVQLAALKADEATAANIRKHLDQIMNSADRAGGLVRQLLLFSRKHSIVDEYPLTDINKTIQNLHEMLNRLIGEDISISLKLAADLNMIRADRGNIEQLLTNLVVNARDAMPDGGEIIIATKNVFIDENNEKQISKAKAGRYVVLSVTDTGSGISQENIPHIFDPFFSTKPEGKGTGLGLSIVYGIAKQHGGWVNAYSELGQGTIFNIYLPQTAATAEEKETATAADRKTVSLAGNDRLVLLIEDEKDVREIAVNILQSKGFRILTAENIETARALFARQKEQIHLVFSDVALPDGNGASLVREFLQEVPGLKVLMTSGYPDHRSRRG
ncbi:MAG: ATP-binding protein, partial [Desulfobulbaceae bacterium]|nr:ATP-binding protein [Desulfobulbaceae bacterium]